MTAPFDIARAMKTAGIAPDQQPAFAMFALGWLSISNPDEVEKSLKRFCERSGEPERIAA